MYVFFVFFHKVPMVLAQKTPCRPFGMVFFVIICFVFEVFVLFNPARKLAHVLSMLIDYLSHYD